MRDALCDDANDVTPSEPDGRAAFVPRLSGDNADCFEIDQLLAYSQVEETRRRGFSEQGFHDN